jgi:hypothetical protein
MIMSSATIYIAGEPETVAPYRGGVGHRHPQVGRFHIGPGFTIRQ